MIAAGHVADMREAFDRWLGRGRPAFVPRDRRTARSGHRHHSRAPAAWPRSRIPGRTSIDRADSGDCATPGSTRSRSFHSDHDAEHVRALPPARRAISAAGDRRLRLPRRPGARLGHRGASTLPPAEWQRLRAAAIAMPEPADPSSSCAASPRTTRPAAAAVQQLDLRRGQALALLGFDAATAEVLVNLITGGAILPDTGEVIVFGRAHHGDHRSRMRGSRCSTVRPAQRRAVLRRAAHRRTESGDSAVARRREHVRRAARASRVGSPTEIGLEASQLSQPVAAAPAAGPVAHRPRPRAGARSARPARGTSQRDALCRRGASRSPPTSRESRNARRIATLVLTADRTFARAVADEVLTLSRRPANCNRRAAGAAGSDSGCRVPVSLAGAKLSSGPGSGGAAESITLGSAFDQSNVAGARALCGIFRVKLDALPFTQQLEDRLPRTALR